MHAQKSKPPQSFKLIMNKVHQAAQRIVSKPDPSLVDLLMTGNAMKLFSHEHDEGLVDRRSFVNGIIGAALDIPLVAELSTRNPHIRANRSDDKLLPQ